MSARRTAAVTAALVVLGTACQPTGSESPSQPIAARSAQPSPARAASHAPEVATRSARSAPRAGQPLLIAAPGGDGDSWRDTAGREYRLGLVNTPELSECYGQSASHERKRLTAQGFRATSYTVDTHGRHVSVVSLPDGRNLNVWLARHGFANDKYLKQFRHENPPLATQLDAAFAAARRERAGLWGACAASPAPVTAQGLAAAPQQRQPPPGRGNCDASYPDVCIAPPPPDLDCPDIPYRRFRVLAPDPHHFDLDHDGIGCESG